MSEDRLPKRPTLPERVSTESAEEEHALMVGIAARDPSALERLYDLHRARLFAICVRILGNGPDAEEVLEDVFFETWDRPERYQASRGAPRVYLSVLARSRALDRVRARLRRARGEVLEPGPEPAATPLAEALDSERRSLAVETLAQLAPAERQLVELSFLEGLTHREIAERLEEPLGTVKTRIRRALLRLRDLFGEPPPQGGERR